MGNSFKNLPVREKRDKVAVRRDVESRQGSLKTVRNANEREAECRDERK